MPQHRSFIIGFLVLAVVAAATAIAPPAAAHQYLQNGDFEQDTEGWTLLSDGSTFDTAPDSVSGVSGSQRARIVLGQPNFRLNQSISDVPPGTYRLKMSVRVESTNAVVRLDVLTDPAWAERFSQPAFASSPGTWQHIDAHIVIPGASWVSIRLIGNGAVGDRIYVDNVAFEGAPPATMTPTHTRTPLPPTNTPIPPTSTKTPKPTGTASPAPTSTEVPGGMGTLAAGSLINGGFEEVADALPLGWSKYGGALSIATDPVRSGAHAATLESVTESTKWLYQTVTVNGGAAYAFEAWLWQNDPNIAAAFLRVSWYASADGSGEAIATVDSVSQLDSPAAGWRHTTTTGVTAPADALTAKLRVMLQPHSPARVAIYVDDAWFGPADPSLSAPADDSVTGPILVNDADHGPDSDTARPRRANVLPAGNASSGGHNIVVNEIVYDSLQATDAEGEWVELYNAGEVPVDLEGWFIADDTMAEPLAEHVLESGHFLIIVASDSLRLDMEAKGIPVMQVQGRIGNSLSNDGDVVALVDPNGRFADAVSWGDDASAFEPAIADVPAGHSIERRLHGTDTNTAADFVDNEHPSPGRAYTPESVGAPSQRVGSSGVQILAGEDGNSLGWIAWVAAGASLGILAVAATTRFAPAIAQRLRHE